jgi:hypothetical protein
LLEVLLKCLLNSHLAQFKLTHSPEDDVAHWRAVCKPLRSGMAHKVHP